MSRGGGDVGLGRGRKGETLVDAGSCWLASKLAGTGATPVLGMLRSHGDYGRCEHRG